jgi:hypothetical protein
VAGNTAARLGGGIANIGGGLVIERSTISGNRAGRTGGGLYNESGLNEDLSPRTGVVNVTNSTVTGNSSATSGGQGTGGLRNEPGGVMNVVHSTIVGNSNDEFFWAAGIANAAGPGTVTINGSIVANNLSGGPGFVVDVGGSFSATSPNVVRSTLYSTLEAGGTPPTVVGNTGLAPLGDYGGPTQTMLPLPGSPAIDKMAPLTPTDQRDMVRDLFNAELGSVEVIPLAQALGSDALTSVNSSNSADTWFSQRDIIHEEFSAVYAAARSGAVGDNQSSQMFAEVTGPGRLTFWWKVSAEGGPTPDRLQFFLDDFVSPARSIDGDPRPPEDIPWQQVTIDLGAGVHFLQWRYTKDASGTAGADAGFVDEVVFTPLGTAVLDATDGNLFSLRNIIATAPAGSTITIDPALAGAVATLTTGQIVIDKNLTIDASALAGGLTISGNDASRIFYIAPGRTVNLRRLTLSRGRPPAVGGGGGGSGGGCLINAGTVSMTEVTLTGCTALSAGGGLSNYGTAVLTRSAVLGNQTGDSGGGIWNLGTLTVANSTIAGNQAASPTSYVGGGIFNAGTLFLRHSTISNNRATAQLGYGGGLVQYSCATSPCATIENSIIAGNSAYLAPDVVVDFGSAAISASGRNLVGIGDPGGASAVFPLGPLVGNAASPVDAVLATLGDYGGPTPSMLPLDGSPAIDAALGGAYVPTGDQRGQTRPQGTARDLGAVEVQPGDPTRDTDNDRMPDARDNCKLVANPSQLDSNGDGYGNLCDADLNNSGLVTTADFGILRSVLNQSAGSSATAAAADLNGSGTVTTADFGILRARLNTAPGPSGLACAGTVPCP